MTDDVEPDFTIPSAIPWRTIGWFVLGGLALVGLVLGVGAVEDCQRAAEREEAARLVEQGHGLAAALRPRLEAARTAALAAPRGDAPERCPADLPTAAPLTVAQADWLAFVLAADRAAPRPSSPFTLNSDVVNRLAGVVGGGGVESLERANRSYEDLATAPLFGVFAADRVATAESSGPGTFEGGGVRGWLVIVDVDAERAVCAVEVASQALFAISLEQSSASAQASEERRALRSSTARAFWRELGERLAEAAPSLRVAEPEIR